MTWVGRWWRWAGLGRTLVGVVILALAQCWIPVQALAPQFRMLTSISTPMAVFWSLPIGALLAMLIREPSELIWFFSPASARLRGAIRVLLALLVYLGITAIAAPSWLLSATHAVMIGLVLTLVSLRWIPHQVAWFAPVAFGFVCGLLGRSGPYGVLSWWAVPAQPVPSVTTVVLEASLLGLVLVWRQFQRPRLDQQ